MEPSLGPWPPNGMAISIFDVSNVSSPSPPSPFSAFGPVSSASFASSGECGGRGWPDEAKMRIDEAKKSKLRHQIPRPPRRRETDNEFGVAFYDRHIVLCHKEPKEWKGYSDNFLREVKLVRAFSKAIGGDEQINFKTQLSVCEGRDGDAFVFPDMIKISGLTTHDVGCFVSDVLKPDDDEVPLLHAERLAGTHILVACHGDRLKSGQEITEQLQLEIMKAEMSEQVFVWRSGGLDRCGGQREANIIIFSEAAGCDWYGGVSVSDVEELVQQHIVQGKIYEDRWIGCMGLDPKEQSMLKDVREHCSRLYLQSCAEPRQVDHDCLQPFNSPLSCSSASSYSTSSILSEGESTMADSPMSSLSGWPQSPRQQLTAYLSHVRDSTQKRWFPRRSEQNRRSIACAPAEEEACEKEQGLQEKLHERTREGKLYLAQSWDCHDTLAAAVFGVSACIGIFTALSRRR